MRSDSRWTYRRPAIFLKTRVRNAARMPELNDNSSTLCVDGVSHFLPPNDLGIGVAARRIGVALSLGGYLGGFGYDQASRSALGVSIKGAVPNFR